MPPVNDKLFPFAYLYILTHTFFLCVVLFYIYHFFTSILPSEICVMPVSTTSSHKTIFDYNFFFLRKTTFYFVLFFYVCRPSTSIHNIKHKYVVYFFLFTCWKMVHTERRKKKCRENAVMY